MAKSETTSGQRSRSWATRFRCAVLTVALLWGILILVSPLLADDYWFLPTGTGADRFASALSLTAERFTSDAGRLANLVLPLMLGFLPRAGLAIVAALLFWGTVAQGRRAALSGPQDSASWLWLAAFTLLMPWYDYLLSTAYFMNYLLPSLLVLLVWRSFLRESQTARKKYYLLILLAAYAAGWCHEGFSAPLLGGMALWIAVRGFFCEEFSGRRLGIAALTLLGVFTVVASPTVGNRAADWGQKTMSLPMWEMAIQFGPAFVSMLICALFSIWALLKLRKPASDQGLNIICLFTMGLLGFIVMMLFYNGPRTGWPSMLYSFVGITASLQVIVGNRALKPISIVSFLLPVLNLGWAIAEQKQHTREYEQVIEDYHHSADGIVYAEPSTPKLTPALLKSSVRALNERVPLEFISNYYRPGTPLGILPPALEKFMPPQVAYDGNTGNAEPGKFGVYKGYVVGLANQQAPTKTAGAVFPGRRIALQTAEGKTLESRFTPVQFTGPDNRRWIWLKLHAQTLNPDLKVSKIKEHR